MKKIILNLAILALIAVASYTGTRAFFSAETTSANNVFTAGNIDLKVDHAVASYNGEYCDMNCDPTGGNLIQNGSFETPAVTANGGSHQFFTSVSDWTREAGTVIELQRNAFVSADGQQHVELDGDEPESATTISQTITTVPGERYRLSFAHSPRPESQAASSGIRLEVAVVGPGGTTFSDTINTGTGPVDWSTYTYEFVANDATTTIRFAYNGTANTYGGLLDNVEVYQLLCEGGAYENTPGGFCELWDVKDLENEKFFNFADVKPQDTGTNLISLHVESNEAYLCLAVNNKEELENTHTAPEIAAGDNSPTVGEMGQFLTVAGWYSDEDGNRLNPLFAPTPVADLGSIAFADNTTANGPVAPGVTEYVHLEWCMGDMTVSGNTVTCDGNVPDINQTQTDAFLSDLQFYAVQTRNNDDFRCEDVVYGEEDESNGDNVIVVTSNSADWGFLVESGADGSGQYEVGPATPPMGAASAGFILNDGATGVALAGLASLAGTPLSDITELSYATYRVAGDAAEAVALQLNFTDDVTVAYPGWQGRLVYEPYYTDTVQTGVWQTWDTLNDATPGNWWFTNGTLAAASSCAIATPCTWSEVLAAFPNGGINSSFGGVLLKVGSGWSGFSGNVDALTIGVSGVNTTYNFEN